MTDASAASMSDSTGKPTLNHALIVKDRNGPKAYWLTAEVYTLGRDADNSICIDSQYVSRKHALLYRVNDGKGGFLYQILDGDVNGNPSTNGLFMGDQRIDFLNLEHGYEIRMSCDVTVTYVTTSKTFDYILST
ncbi:MAG: FHA domain-containing protein, partial [Cyanobacteria bacterium P01_G01_bin.4]